MLPGVDIVLMVGSATKKIWAVHFNDVLYPPTAGLSLFQFCAGTFDRPFELKILVIIAIDFKTRYRCPRKRTVFDRLQLRGSPPALLRAPLNNDISEKEKNLVFRNYWRRAFVQETTQITGPYLWESALLAGPTVSGEGSFLLSRPRPRTEVFCFYRGSW